MNEAPPKSQTILSLTILLLVIVCGHPAYPGILPLDQVVMKVQSRYDQTQDLQADFTQRATIKSVNQTLTEEGTVFFKKPKRMLWEYRTPSNKKMVITPAKAWLYIPEDDIVYVQDAEKVITSKMIVRFITGIGQLKEDFTLAFSPQHPTDDEGNYVIRLTPRSRDIGVETLRMTIDKNTFYIVDFSFTDLYGNVTSLTFKNMKTNIALPDTLFTFTPPEGAQIYEVP